MKVFQIQMETGRMKVFWLFASGGSVVGAVLSAASHDWFGMTFCTVSAILYVVLAYKGTRD